MQLHHLISRSCYKSRTSPPLPHIFHNKSLYPNDRRWGLSSVHLDVHTKLCDLYGVFKKVSTLEAMYHLCHHLLRHHPLPKRKKNYYIQQLLNQNTKSHTWALRLWSCYELNVPSGWNLCHSPLAKSTFQLVLYNQNHSNQNGQSEQREISLRANEN